MEIWQVARQQCFQATPAILQSTCLEYFKIQPHSFESSRDMRDVKIRRLSYNLVNIGPVSMPHIWNGVSKKYFGNSSVAKRTTVPAIMGRPLRLWVAFGDRATVFRQHCYIASLGHNELTHCWIVMRWDEMRFIFSHLYDTWHHKALSTLAMIMTYSLFSLFTIQHQKCIDFAFEFFTRPIS